MDTWDGGRVRKAELSTTGHFQDACPHCRALHLKAERSRCPELRLKAFGACCQYGVLSSIPVLPPAPPPLAEMVRIGRSHEHFRQYIHGADYMRPESWRCFLLSAIPKTGIFMI